MNQWSVQRIIGVIAAAVVILGAFLPWATLSGLVTGSITGTNNGASDGWFMSAFATIAIVAFLVHNRALYIVAAVCSVLGIALAVFNIVDISRLTGDLGLEGVEVSVGIGLWLTAVGIVVSGVLTVICATQVRTAPPAMPAGYPNFPQAGYPNYPQAGYPNYPQAGYPNNPQAGYPNNPQAGYPNYPQTGAPPQAAPPQAPPTGAPNQPPPPPPYGG